MDNMLTKKSQYTAHRRGDVAADSADLAVLLASHGRGAINANGFDSLHGFVKLVGGVTPTVTIQPLERVDYVDGAGVAQQRLVVRGSSTAALADGASFEIPTVGGGAWLMRLHAVAGAPTGVEVYLAGGQRANEGSI